MASNPNTPIEMLKKLAGEFPDELMNNPVLDILILENLDSIRTIKTAVARSPNASEEILNRLKDDSGDRYIIYAIAENPHAPERILDYLKSHEDYDIHCAVAQNPNTSERILDYLKSHEDGTVRCIVAQSHNITESILA